MKIVILKGKGRILVLEEIRPQENAKTSFVREVRGMR